MSAIGRRERIGLVIGIAAIVAAYAWSGHYWVDVVDEGYFLDLSRRVLDGALPYRDFDTYYTPGIFYLFALAFKLFGTNLLVIRYVMAAMHGGCALLMYLLTRRIAPWPIAWLPVAVIVLLDSWPIEPEPHPSWPAILACLATLEFLVRHQKSGQLSWVALAGAAAGTSYLFKQNLGAFTALGVGGYVLLRPRADRGLSLRVLQIGFAVTSAALVSVMMQPEIDALSAGALWLPLMVLIGVLTFRATRPSLIKTDSVWLEGSVAAGAFGAVTVAWMAPLVVAIGPAQTPFALFVGDVNQAALATAFAAFTWAVPWLLITVTWTVALLALPRFRPRRVVACGVVLTALALMLPIWQGPRDPLTFDAQFAPYVGGRDQAFGTLHLYLPSIAVWAGIANVVASAPDPTDPLPVLVLFGALANLALYPRADTLHVVVSGAPSLVAGGAVMARFSRVVAGWRRVGMLGALTLVPTLALAPQVAWRAASVISPTVDDTQLRWQYGPLDAPDASVLVPRQMAADLNGVADYVDARTAPGEPLFVYPAAPLLNFLADRPNPTRWDHYLPHTLTSDELGKAVVELRVARPRYVVWDTYGVAAWETEPANAVLSGYVQGCYRYAAQFGSYEVLERRGACR